MPTAYCRQIFQAQVFADAILQVHDQVAVLQFGKVNVERGARGERMGRFDPARALNPVTAKNFRIGDNNEPGLVANESAGQRADLRVGSGVLGLASGVWGLGLLMTVAADVRRLRLLGMFRGNGLRFGSLSAPILMGGERARAGLAVASERRLMR